ncbi:MAG: hypothetical protein NZ553_13300, partial [Caldilinea sp.]|nr:hypothetical protein [Caldilinea sp.]MDW8441447.1 hypothetical protein [Caldilineaceae bacterium]
MRNGSVRRTLYRFLSLGLMLAMVLAGCAPAAPSAAPEAAPERKLTIAFSVPAMSFPFFVHMEKQVRDEAARIGNIEIITLDGQD